MAKKRQLSTPGGNVQKSMPWVFPKGLSSKAAALPGLPSHFGGVGLTLGAYSQYVSTAKGLERRWPVCRSLGEGWRLFSTFPIPTFPTIPNLQGGGRVLEIIQN